MVETQSFHNERVNLQANLKNANNTSQRSLMGTQTKFAIAQ